MRGGPVGETEHKEDILGFKGMVLMKCTSRAMKFNNTPFAYVSRPYLLLI